MHRVPPNPSSCPPHPLPGPLDCSIKASCTPWIAPRLPRLILGAWGAPFPAVGWGAVARGGTGGEGQVLGEWRDPRALPASPGIRETPLPSRFGGWQRPGMGSQPPSSKGWKGRNSAPKSQGPSLHSRRWNGKGRGRGRSPCAPQVSPWGCLSSWDPGIPEGGGLGAPGSRGVTSVGSGERGSAGSRGVTGTGGWGDFGAEASGVCWIPKMLGQRLAPRGEGTEPPGRGCGVTGDLPGPSGDPGDADKGGVLPQLWGSHQAPALSRTPGRGEEGGSDCGESQSRGAGMFRNVATPWMRGWKNSHCGETSLWGHLWGTRCANCKLGVSRSGPLGRDPNAQDIPQEQTGMLRSRSVRLEDLAPKPKSRSVPQVPVRAPGSGGSPWSC